MQANPAVKRAGLDGRHATQLMRSLIELTSEWEKIGLTKKGVWMRAI